MGVMTEEDFLKNVVGGETEAIQVESDDQAPSVPDTEGTIENEDPTLLEKMGAAFGKNNTIVGAVTAADEGLALKKGQNFDFDPYENDMEKIAGYEDRPDAFIGADSDEEMDLIKKKLDREDSFNEILSSGSTWSTVTAELAAGIADPLILLPVVKGISVASKTGMALQGAAQGAGIGLAASVTRESTFQGMQESRGMDESVLNVLTESAMGGILGGAVGALSKSSNSAARMVLTKAMRGEDFMMKVGEDGVPFVERSVGASEVTNALEDEGLARINETLAGITGGGFDFLKSPSLRGVTSSFGTMRQFTNKMFNHNFIIGKETKGVSRGDVAENLIRRDDAQLTKINKTVNDLYLNHTGTGALRASVSTPKGKLSFTKFNERVSKVLRDDTYEDAIPEVNAAAKLYRTQMDATYKKMAELKLLPDDIDPKLAKNYLTRIYDTSKLNNLEVRNSFINKVGGWYRTHNPDGSLRATPMDELDAMEAAQDTLDKIMRQGDAALAFNDMPEQIISKGKFTKERMLLMPDSELEEFLVNDAQELVTNYTRRANSMIRVQNAMNEMGFESLQDLRVSMKSEKDRMLAGITDTKKRAKLEDQFAKDTALMTDMYRMMTGSISKPGGADRLVRTLMQYQFTRLLGGVLTSSFPELGMAPLKYGLLNTLKDGYLPMVRDWKAAKLSKDQLKDLDIGLEHETSNILRILSDHGVETGRRTTEYDRIMSSITDKFGKATGLTHYTSFGRRLGASVAMSNTVRLLRQSQAKGLSKAQITKLANTGISESDYGKVLKMIDKHSQESGGSFISNHHMWSDQEAATIFRNSIQNQVETVILKPGKGDIPVFAQKHTLGKLAFQFKSFMSAATGKITIRGMQDRDAKTAAGIVYLTALGVTSQIVKDKIAGRETTDDPTQLILEGVSRSGMMGLIGTTLLDTGMTMYDRKSRRYAGKFVQGNVFGPTGSQIGDIVDIMGRMADGDVSESDQKAVQRMIPFLNLFYIQALMNEALND